MSRIVDAVGLQAVKIAGLALLAFDRASDTALEP
jgi:hypothetical protein